jgi:uncharacterized protein (DUF608 family)
MSGGKQSWILGDYEGFASNGGWFNGHSYGRVYDTYLYGFRDTGELPSLTGDRSPVSELDEAGLPGLSHEQKLAAIEKLSQYPSMHAFFERIRKVAPNDFNSEEGISKIAAEAALRLTQLSGRNNKKDVWGNAALCSKVTLQPGETKQVSVVLSWAFPHHFSGDGPEMGHMYSNWFADSLEANKFLVSNLADHHRKVNGFCQTMAHTSLPPEVSSCWTQQLSTITKCTWWTKANRFAVWEGLGCCGFHTMDITYQGSFSILALFPELQKSQMRMGTDFQRADGRVAHFFTPDLLHVDNGFDRVDMNPQFVMLCCRDYLWTDDKEYLNRVFPSVIRAMANTAKLDTDGDGLPDHDTRRNTYDAWNFFGAPAYISSLWLGALAAGARMAKDLGCHDLAESWLAILEKGKQSFDKVLWNGEYYSLWVDGEHRDECCMSDQLSGIWFSHLIGLGDILPPERVKSVLKTILKYNFSPETGLVNATYPPGRTPRPDAYMNAQASANWTGVEYAFASMLFDFDLHDEAIELVRSISDRYVRAGRVWNHTECGDHYYRAMSSWATMLGATGLKLDVPASLLIVRDDVTAPWVSAKGYGTLESGVFKVVSGVAPK